MLDVDIINKTPFFFIVANGRSGTTMLQNILDANNEVIIPIESRLIIHLKKKYFHKKKWNDLLIDSFIEDLYEDKKFARYWNVNREHLTKQIKTVPKNQITFQLLCKIIYLSYPTPYKKNSIKIIGDKNPIYCLFLNDLMEIFPNAKFIHLVRDYHASINSALKTFGFTDIPVVSHGWVMYNKYVENKKQSVPNSFLTIRYEDLVSNPKEKITDVCDFLAIPFQENMLNFSKTVKNEVLPVVNDSVRNEINTIHPHLSNPINTKQINKWRKDLTQKQIITIEYIAAEYASKYGYKRDSSPNTQSLLLWIYKVVGLVRLKINYSIIRSYYKLPQRLRFFSTKISSYIYTTFNYTHYFNSADFRHKQNPK